MVALLLVGAWICPSCKEDPAETPTQETPEIPEEPEEPETPVYHNPDTTVAVNFNVFNPPPEQPVGSLWKLRDPRDSKTYLVKLLNDGNYWMVQDLRYGGATDACANKTTFDTDRYHNYFEDIQTNRFGPNSYGECRRSTQGNARGYYYDWAAAMQSPWAYSFCPLKTPKGTWCTAGTYQPTHEVQGICPDGWHVPAAYDFVNMDALLNGPGKALYRTNDNESLAKWTDAFGLTDINGYAGDSEGTVYGVGWDNPQYGWSGGENDFWTSSWPINSSEGRTAYYFNLSATTATSSAAASCIVAPASNAGFKYFGYNVRCIRNTDLPADPPPAPVDPSLPFIDQLVGTWKASEISGASNLEGTHYFDNTHEVILEKVDANTIKAINMTDGHNLTGTAIGNDTVFFHVNADSRTLEPFFQPLEPSWHPDFYTYFAMPGSNCEGGGVTYKPLPVTEKNGQLTIVFPTYETKILSIKMRQPVAYQIKVVPKDPSKYDYACGLLTEPMATVWRKK
jgi:uncharacterized protein (TIGR02145 family)